MKKLLSGLMLAAVCGLAPAWAQDPAPAAAAPAAEAAAPAVTTTPAPEAAPAAAPEPAPVAAEVAPAALPACGGPGFDCNKGDTTWLLTATAFVLLMSLPGLALFYGGMVRSKNMLSTLTQTFAIFSLIAVLWVVYGYSVAFSNGSQFFGGLSKMFLDGVVWTDATNSYFVPAATFSRGQYLPEILFAMFQLTFAAITVSLVAGAYAERMKFKAVLIFSVLWFTFAYLPMAHMVWWWAGPDAYNSDAIRAALEAGNAELVTKLKDEQTATAGMLWQWGALDFAGGTVVHINAGVAGLVCAIILGKRKTIGPPHSLTMSMIGASLLWFGWFGFNAGSNLEANGYAALAFANTLIATAVAALAWFFAEWALKGKPSLLGIISGAVAGLVAITPACGFVGIKGALVIGLLSGVICFVAVSFIKKALGYDDALDAFGVHAVGGIVGAILTGVFVDPAKGGAGYAMDWSGLASPTFGYDAGQILIQIQAVGVAVVWSAAVAAVSMLLLKYTIGIRVTEEQESEGLDVAEHGEKAYT